MYCDESEEWHVILQLGYSSGVVVIVIVGWTRWVVCFVVLIVMNRGRHMLCCAWGSNMNGICYFCWVKSKYVTVYSKIHSAAANCVTGTVNTYIFTKHVLMLLAWATGAVYFDWLGWAPEAVDFIDVV